MGKYVFKIFCVMMLGVLLLAGCSKEGSSGEDFTTGNVDFNKYYDQSYKNVIKALQVPEDTFLSDAPDSYRNDYVSGKYIKYKGKDSICTITCKDEKVQMIEIVVPFTPEQDSEYQKSAHAFAVELYDMYKNISGKEDEFPSLGGGDNPKDWLHDYLDDAAYENAFDSDYENVRTLNAAWNLDNDVQVRIALVNAKETNNAKVVVQYMKKDSVYAIN